MKPLALPLMLVALSAAVPPGGQLEVHVERLRNAKGVVHACLTANPRFFPDCSKDPGAIKHTAPATTRSFRLNGIQPGRYALTVVHDENANDKFEKMLGIPREGFGFSRNPVVRFGAPKFKDVDIELGRGLARHSVRMQYLL